MELLDALLWQTALDLRDARADLAACEADFAEAVRALAAMRSAADEEMGDTDLDEDNSPLFSAMLVAAKALSTPRARRVMEET